MALYCIITLYMLLLIVMISVVDHLEWMLTSHWLVSFKYL